MDQVFQSQEERLLKLKKSPLYHDSPKTTLLFAAQARSFEARNEVTKIKNPFISDSSSFENHICSPGFLDIGKGSKEFSWSIDEMSKIQPVDIDSPKYIIEEYDENTEFKAQEAFEKYFAQTHNIVSPIDSCVGNWQSPGISTPVLSNMSHSKKCAVSSTPYAKAAGRRLVVKSEANVQTNLSFPPQLLPEIEAMFKPYYNENFTSDNVDTDEANLNNSTLRRKLFFNKEDELSTVKNNIDSPALNYTDRVLNRMIWSDEKMKSNDCPSSPDLSPIKTNSSSQSFKSWEDDECNMAISLELIDGNQDIYSSTKLSLNSQDSEEMDSADTGYRTLHESQSLSKSRNQLFNSTSIYNDY